MPGADGALQAPHLNVTIFMRGMLKHLITRIYFPDDPANATDPVLGARAGGAARHAGRPPRGSPACWRGTCILQGDGETVFFEC